MKRYKLLREYICHSEMYEVSPTEADLRGRKLFDETTDLWNEYYQIVEYIGYGEWELREDFYSYKEAVKRLQELEYEAYEEECGEPVCFTEWLDTEWQMKAESVNRRLEKGGEEKLEDEDEAEDETEDEDWCIKCGKCGKFEDGICEHCKQERKA